MPDLRVRRRLRPCPSEPAFRRVRSASSNHSAPVADPTSSHASSPCGSRPSGVDLSSLRTFRVAEAPPRRRSLPNPGRWPHRAHQHQRPRLYRGRVPGPPLRPVERVQPRSATDRAGLEAAARPGELTFGSTGAGTGSHLGAALLNLEAGLTAVHRLTTSCSGARRSRHLSQRRIGTCPGHEAGEIGNDEEEARPSLGDERLADLTPRRKKQQCPFTRSARRFTGRSGVTVTSSVSGDLAPGANVRRLRSHPDIGTMHVFCRPSGNRHDAGRAPRRRVLTSGRSSSGSRR